MTQFQFDFKHEVKICTGKLMKCVCMFQIESLAMSKTSLAKNSQMLRPLSRKDIFYSGSIANLPEFRLSQKSLTTYRQSVISLPKLKAGSEMDGPVTMEADKGGYKIFFRPK